MMIFSRKNNFPYCYFNLKNKLYLGNIYCGYLYEEKNAKKKKQELPVNYFIFLRKKMVRPGGLEPLTFWFVAKQSIQLIYGRTLVVSLFWRFLLDSNQR